MSLDTSQSVRRITFLGNHLPRRCGIATFTTDLAEAICTEFPDLGCSVVAMNDPGMRHAYGERVRFEIAESELSSYRRAADFLNVGTTDVLSVQHEYGIFGGKAGSYVLALLRELRVPIVTTLHTIVGEPSADQRRVMDEVVRLSTRLVVMSRHGAALLHDVHGAPQDKIDIIPHGIPGLPRDPDQQDPARPGRQVGDPDVRAAIAGQGHRVRHRGAAARRRAPPGRDVCRGRRDAPAREGAQRRSLPARPCTTGTAAGRRLEHHLP